MVDIAGWIAPIATMLAAMMTAANLGARVTGWGFIVFTVGSIGWCTVALASGQQNLLLTNGFLTVVNLVGIWRWLGRQARYEDGGQRAAEHSAAGRVPSLFAAGALPGATIAGLDGKTVATVVDAMLRCTGAEIEYLVIREGGVAGVGERLHALSPKQLRFAAGRIDSDFDTAGIASLPVVPADAWPATLPEAA